MTTFFNLYLPARRTNSARVLFACLLAACAAPTLHAHVTMVPGEAVADTYFKASFRVPHGCDGSPTVRLRVRIPEGVTSVRPQVHPPWKIDIVRRKLDRPQEGIHGSKVTETVQEIAWSGGRVPDDMFDEFAVMMRLPDKPGTTLYFPVLQECESGVARWIEIPATTAPRAESPHPAPALRLLPPRQ